MIYVLYKICQLWFSNQYIICIYFTHFVNRTVPGYLVRMQIKRMSSILLLLFVIESMIKKISSYHKLWYFGMLRPVRKEVTRRLNLLYLKAIKVKYLNEINHMLNSWSETPPWKSSGRRHSYPPQYSNHKISVTRCCRPLIFPLCRFCCIK